MTLTIRFDHDQNGAPVTIVDGHPGLTATLADAVSAHRPAGVGGPSTSTYRVDWVLHAIEANRTSTGSVAFDPVVLSSGNTTRLAMGHAHARVESLHDLFAPAQVSIDDLVEILHRSREAIVRAAGQDDPQPFLRPPEALWVAGPTGVEPPPPT